MEQWEIVATVPCLPRNTVTANRRPKVIDILSLPNQIQMYIKNSKAYLKHVIKGEDQVHHILERYGQNFGIIWEAVINDDVMNDINSISEHYKKAQEVEEVFDSNEFIIKDWEDLRLSKIINNYGEGRRQTLNSSEPLIMRLPDDLVPANENTTTTNEVTSDPKTYFEEKYFCNVFDLTMPLAYFVKSSLSRTKNLCKIVCVNQEYQNMYEALIHDNIMPVPTFDERHDTYRILEMEFGIPFVAEFQRKCIEQYGYQLNAESKLRNDTYDFENVTFANNTNNLLKSILKLRELKLQIILILEMLYMNKLDEKFKDFEATYKQKLVQRSRNLSKVRFRNRRSKKKTTLNKSNSDNPSEVIEESEKTSSNKDGNIIAKTTTEAIDYCELLDLYLDKLTILDILITSGMIANTEDINSTDTPTGWEQLKEYQARLIDKNNEASLVGFANYILIPYFSKKTPQAIKFVIKKLKGPSLRRNAGLDRSKTIERNKSDLMHIYNKTEIISETPTRKNSFSSINYSSDDKADGSGNSKIRPSIPSIQENTNLSRTSSNLSEFFDTVGPPLKKLGPVSRTKSDLSFLQRRQFAMDLPKIVDEEKIPTDGIKNSLTQPTNNNLSQTYPRQGMNSITRTKQQSFRRVGRQNSTKITKKAHELITPGQTNLVQVMATPMGKGSARNTKSAFISPGIIESPDIGTGISTPSIQNQLANGPDKNNTSAGKSIVSPKQKKVKRRLFAP
ncbi:hypothetical protein RNJ44_01453 [Nakaseomyces bracarensis]|uniref:DNA replication regulator Sld3 C-terminal domain-containing protein n=1 Tax=Nakaseomyces bracarensis TaxID=273131 RepID=A0ABR4NPQ8_9SACH